MLFDLSGETECDIRIGRDTAFIANNASSGGALAIAVSAQTHLTQSTVSIDSARFQANSAIQNGAGPPNAELIARGGAVLLALDGDVSRSSFAIQNTSFSQNVAASSRGNATASGGAVHLHALCLSDLCQIWPRL